MVFAVVVDVPPVEAASAARTLSTCNAALGPEQCVLSGSNPGSHGAPRWYAVVRYGTEGEARLTIELYDGNRDGSRVASSELQFKERDPPEERWASVGVVVAALVLAQPADSRTNQKPGPAPVVAAPPKAPTRSAPASSPSLRLRFELGVTAGSEVRSAPLRVGPLVRVGLALPGVPIFAFASGAYTVRNSTITDLKWLSGSLGAGASVGFAQQRAALEVRTEAVLETLGMQATDEVRTESARRTRFGGRLGLDLCGYWAKNWAFVLGAEAGVFGPRVMIDALGQTEELPPFVWGILSAVRYDFR